VGSRGCAAWLVPWKDQVVLGVRIKRTVIDCSRIARKHLLPMICAIAASLALGLAPFLHGRQVTGDWSAPSQSEIRYYLSIAAQPYFEQVPYLSDPSVPGGAILYPWLQYVPAVYFARAFGLNVFSITIIWTVFASVAMAATLYGLFWYFLRWPWLAAGLTITFLADGSRYHPFIHQIHVLLGWLIYPQPYLPLYLFHYRLTNPAVDLPFVFLQILAVAVARNQPNRLRIWISGASFALLFYVYFYAWTITAAALGLAFLVDREQRGLYAKTFAIGFVAGVPAIVRGMLVRRALSAEGVTRFGLFTPSSPNDFLPLFGSHDLILIPCVSVALIAWFLASGNHQLTYLWCLAVAGFALSHSFMITGIYLHDYHWEWFACPIFSVLLCLAAATVVTGKVRFSPALGWMWGIWVVSFSLTGLYVSTVGMGVRDYVEPLRDYAQYKAQRFGRKGAAVLNPRTMIAGDDRFCELSVIGENMRALGGWWLYISMALKDSDLYARYALNQYLNGVSARNQFKAIATRGIEHAPAEMIDGFVRAFDEVASDPRKFLDAYDVEYVALRTDQPLPAYIKDGWVLIEGGPYWQIWQRAAPPPPGGKTTVNAGFNTLGCGHPSPFWHHQGARESGSSKHASNCTFQDRGRVTAQPWGRD
jgi:hypothetical protein